MKKINKLIPITLVLLVSLFFGLSSCDKMDDIQRQYAEKEEQVYLGKVDSIEYFSGFGRAKITWYIGSDPKVDRTIIYWNMRKDSIVKEFDRKTSGVQKDSIILEDLPEGTTLFEFRNINDAGETSLYSSASITVWGSAFADGLRARELTAFDFDYAQSLYSLNLSPTSLGDSVIYSEIVYTNSVGQEKAIKIERETEQVELAGFPDGGEFQFRTVFFPSQGIDTVYGDYKIYNAPTAVHEKGTKLSLTGNMESKYFVGNGEILYEWNANGDLIAYAVNADGSLTKTETHASVVPRDTYRDFFFYDDDKFIGIGTNNAVTMHTVSGDALTTILTPAGAASFGSGFSFQAFIPSKGYFLSLTAGSGDLKAWLAQNDATWGAPNGATVGTGYTIYEPLMLFNHEALLGVDAEGYLWSTPVTVSGKPGSKSRIGSGWNRFKKIVSVGTKLFCMEENGDMYVFNDFNITDKFWIVD